METIVTIIGYIDGDRGSQRQRDRERELFVVMQLSKCINRVPSTRNNNNSNKQKRVLVRVCVCVCVLPLVIFFMARLLASLSDAAEGFYVFSPESSRESRLGCLALAGQQVSIGIVLALVTGAVRGWLQPRARDRSAALGRRLLVTYPYKK